MQRLSRDNFGASENIINKLFQATWWTLVHKQKLEMQGKERREAAWRRNSECSRPTAQRWLAGDWPTNLDDTLQVRINYRIRNYETKA